jgi:hypothetical protein
MTNRQILNASEALKAVTIETFLKLLLVLLGIVGALLVIIQGLIAYIFVGHTRTDDARDSERKIADDKLASEIKELRAIMLDHGRACTEKARTDAAILVQIQNLGTTINTLHEQNVQTLAAINSEIVEIRRLNVSRGEAIARLETFVETLEKA